MHILLFTGGPYTAALSAVKGEKAFSVYQMLITDPMLSRDHPFKAHPLKASQTHP